MDIEEKVNILIVDDQPKNLLGIEAILDRLGQNLVKAISGKEALMYLLQKEFAVILLDVQMSEMDGFETAKLIRARPTLRHTPIIFLTAIDRDDRYIEQAYSLGAVDYLSKPIVPEILLSKVAAFIALFQATQAVKQQAAQLQAANQKLEREIAKREQAEAALRQANEQLENKVRARTAELIQTNEALQEEILERKRTEEELKLTQFSIDRAVDPIAWIGADANFLYVNEALCHSLGYSREELLSMHVSQVDPDFSPAVWSDFWQRLKQKKPFCFESHHCRKDGRMFPVEITANYLEFNGTEYACCFARDIREQKLAELVLRESEQRLQAILDNSPVAIYLKDPQGRYLLVNCQYERICHVTEEQIVGKTDYEIFPKEIADSIVSNDKRAIEAGQAIEFEEAVTLPDGMHIFISQKFPLYDSIGMPYGVCCISTDITKRIQIEESLRDSQRFIQQITDTAPTMIYVFNPNQMRNTYLNRYGIDFFARTLQEIQTLGKQFFVEVLHPDDLWKLDKLNERFAKAKDGEIIENEFRMKNAKGEWRWLHSWDIVLSRTEEGLPEQILGTAIDITEQKQTEEIRHALQAEKALRRFQLHFFSRASHEFRTPLSTILGSAQILESSSESWSESKRLRNIQRIKGAAKHLTQLLDDILTINRAEAGKLDVHPQPIEIEKFCQTLVEEMRVQANSQISLNFSSGSRGKQVICDEKLLRSILTNLIANALKYSQQGGEIQVILTDQEEAVVLQVKDHGIGIPQDDQNHLFELFYRGKNVENIPGTGLGLSVVKKCLDLQGGKIAIASEVGKGTTATVTLPIHPPKLKIPHERS